MQTYKITISGELGSGKSSLSKLLCAKADFKILSVGAIQRELAEQHGMSTLEFNKYMETHPEIDIECDNKVVEYGLSDANLILDSRMAWHFVPHGFKIHLLVNMHIAAHRIFNDNIRKNEENNDIEHTLQNIVLRKASEVKRFKEQYKVDINNLNNYNLVLDSSHISPDNLSDFVLKQFETWKLQQSFHRVWLSPKNLFPLQGIREHGARYITEVKESIAANGYKESEPIQVIQQNGLYFIYDGHKRCTSSISLGLDLVPVVILNQEADVLPNGQSFENYIEDHYNITNVYDWEDMNGFRFSSYL
jgi:cytidylate kinase